MSAVHPARRASDRPQLRQAPGRGRARGRHAGPAGRRRVSRAGAHCLRSPGWRPGISASGSSTASTSRFAPVRRWRSSARTARARRRSSGRSPGCFAPMEGRVVLDGKDLDPPSGPPHLARGNRVRPGRAAPVPGDDREEQPGSGRLSKPARSARRSSSSTTSSRGCRSDSASRRGTLSGGEQQMLAVGSRAHGAAAAADARRADDRPGPEGRAGRRSRRSKGSRRRE